MDGTGGEREAVGAGNPDRRDGAALHQRRGPLEAALVALERFGQLGHIGQIGHGRPRTTTPSLHTMFTRSFSPKTSRASPDTATTSARLPGSNVPNSLDKPS